MTHSAQVYVACVVNETEESDEQVDLDGIMSPSLIALNVILSRPFTTPGEVISFENLVSSIFEFVHALVETPRFRSAVRDGISQIIYYIILFMQITEEQVATWTASPDRFVEDESEDSFSYSVRLAAQDVLLVKHFFVLPLFGYCYYYIPTSGRLCDKNSRMKLAPVYVKP